LEEALDHDADDEALGAVMEVVDVDDRDLARLPVDLVRLGIGGVGAANQVPAMEAGGIEPAQERRNGAGRGGAHPGGGFRGEIVVDEGAELVEAADVAALAGMIGEEDRRRLLGIVFGLARQDRLDTGDEVGDLAALVAGLGEEEAEEPILYHVANGPE